MSKNTTYVILNQEQANSSLGELLNTSPVVSQVTFDHTNPHVLGGTSVPHEQIRDFRANTLENRELQEDVAAYTINIPESPVIDQGESLRSALRSAIPSYTSDQITYLQNLGNSQSSIDDGILINNAVTTAIEELTNIPLSDTVYASRLFNAIYSVNTSSTESLSRINHLFFFNDNNRFSLNFENQISSILINTAGGSLASRILNIFLALGVNFMDFIHLRFTELSSHISNTENSYGLMNVPTQLFFVRVRQSLISIFILFLGLEHFVSIDLNTFLIALRSATLSISILLTARRGYQLLNVPVVASTNIINAERRVQQYSSQNTNSSWMAVRMYYNSYIRPLINLLSNNPGGAIVGILASGVFIFQTLSSSGLLTQIGYTNTNIFLRSRSGPISSFFNEFSLGMQQFLRRFRRF